MPALLTRMSSRPNACFVSAKRRRMSACLETSPCTAIALPPFLVISETTRSAPVLLVAKLTTTAAPSAARCVAMAAPIPLDAPVTTATLPDNFCDMIMLPLFRGQVDRGRTAGGRETPDDGEEHGRQQDSEEGHTDHPGEDRGAERPPHLRPGTVGDYQREDAEDERERGHQDRPQPHLGGLDRGVEPRRAFELPVAGELDDQNGVLARQADQHHEPD